MVRLREKVFRNSSGYKFNVSFVDWTSVFVKSVLEAKVTKNCVEDSVGVNIFSGIKITILRLFDCLF